jgi:microcystin-dependent protein
MSYIRGALPFLIYNPNTRDDIVPNGSSSSFELSQEVPGGYENNVQVIRREFKSDVLVQSCSSIAFDGLLSQISCSESSIAAALSLVQVGDVVRVQGATNAANNGDLLITAVTYNGQNIVITVDDTGLITESAGSLVTLTRRFVGSWEILEPEIDYVIGGTGNQVNKIITFSKIPQETDVIYVIHRGEATYNFVPTEKTVGPEQLQENLRNFKVDIFTGDGSSTDFNLSQFAVNARTLELSVDGFVKYGSDVDAAFVGDFELLSDGTTIRFASPPSNGAKIYVRHLGFSTVSRRQALSPSQIGSVAPGSINTVHLANNAVTSSKIADGAVTNTKIQDGAVSGSKILLNNNESLNWKSAVSPFSATSVLRLDATNNAILRAVGGKVSVNLSDTKLIEFSSSSIKDASASGQVDLGSSANKFKDAFLSGQISSATASVSGNASVGGDLSVTGNIIVDGNVDGVDVSALQAQVNALAALVAQNSAAGTITLWARDTGAPAGYLLCDGGSYSTSVYPNLFAAIGYTFGGSGATFSVPDFRGRFPLGKASSGTGSGWGTGPSARGGSLDHTHTTPAHTHGLANHVHTIPSHYHAMIFNNSTLAINPSGDHQTSLNHDHGTYTTPAGEGLHEHNLNIATGAVTSSNGAHSHGFSLSAATASLNHRHYINFNTSTESATHTHPGTTDSSGTHDHDISALQGTDVSDGNSNRAFSATNTSFTHTRNTSSAGNHTHSFTTGNNSQFHVHAVTGNSDFTDVSHGHSITGSINDAGAHTHSVVGRIFNYESNHQHTVDLPEFTGLSGSNGTHRHFAGDFSGAIGNVSSGSDGNAGFNSGPPSPNSTDSGGALNTGQSNPAFQTINFIIKT